jgi:hypothetical protein
MQTTWAVTKKVLLHNANAAFIKEVKSVFDQVEVDGVANAQIGHARDQAGYHLFTGLDVQDGFYAQRLSQHQFANEFSRRGGVDVFGADAYQEGFGQINGRNFDV